MLLPVTCRKLPARSTSPDTVFSAALAPSAVRKSVSRLPEVLSKVKFSFIVSIPTLKSADTPFSCTVVRFSATLRGRRTVSFLSGKFDITLESGSLSSLITSVPSAVIFMAYFSEILRATRSVTTTSASSVVKTVTLPAVQSILRSVIPSAGTVSSPPV